MRCHKWRRSLNPKMLQCCNRLIEEYPEGRDRIVRIMRFLAEDKMTNDHHMNPPYDWVAENWEQDHILYHNGVFYIEVRQGEGLATVTIESSYFGTQERGWTLPIKREISIFENIFEALWHAEFIKEQLESKYFS